MLPCLGWVVAALLLGYLLGSRFPERTGLRKRCSRIVVYRGRSGWELAELLGGPAQDVCLGVHDEHG